MGEIISSAAMNNNNMCMPISFDQLPDDLLVSIVSRLPLKEAARTSTLSHKWRYFWLYTSVLDFNGSQVLRLLKEWDLSHPWDRSLRYWLNTERLRFVNFVDSILKSHSGGIIEEFGILFDLGATCSNDIDRWLKFAFTRSVKRLKLDLVRSVRSRENYEFPNICDPIERARIFPAGLSISESLVTLSFSRVNVSGEVLEFFVSNCTLLEELFVEFSYTVTSLRILSPPSTRLRRLEIRDCMCLKVLEICSPNLLSFTLKSERVYIDLKNVSSLINLSLKSIMPRALAYNLVQISMSESRLETLVIQLCTIEVCQPIPKFPKLRRLKKLVFDVNGDGYESLLCFAPLIDAAPMLREFVLKLTGVSAKVENQKRRIDSRSCIKGQRHERLKVIAIEGFVGSRTEVELAMHLIERAVSLKILIISFHRRLRRQKADVTETYEVAMARKGVHLLVAKCRNGVKLILN